MDRHGVHQTNIDCKNKNIRPEWGFVTKLVMHIVFFTTAQKEQCTSKRYTYLFHSMDVLK